LQLIILKSINQLKCHIYVGTWRIFVQ